MPLAKSGKPKYNPKLIRGWGGMNNRLPQQALGATKDRPDFLRNALNVSFDDAGRPQIRTGRRKVYTGSNCRSLFRTPTGLVFAEGGNIRRLDTDTMQATTIDTGVDPSADVAFVAVNDETYWSDGVATGKVGDTLWGIPLHPVPTLAAIGNGGLAAGRYHVAVTRVHGSEEGGAMGLYPVDVAEGGGIAVTGLVTPCRVYVTSTNGELLLRYAQVNSGSSIDIGVSANLGAQLKTLRAYPFPACTILAYNKGRVIGANGRYIYRSMAFQPRLCLLEKDFLAFDSDVTMIAPVKDGFYASDSNQTWFFPEAEDGSIARQEPVLSYPAIKGTVVEMPPNEEEQKPYMAWFSTRGWILAGDGGAAKNATEDDVDVLQTIERGAALFRELNGRRELVSALRTRG